MMINEAQAQATAASGRGDGRYPSGLHDGAEISTAAGETKAEVPLTMEAVITRENLMLAYQRVVENKGAAELKLWLKKNWRSVRQALIDGKYQPRVIRRMDIPKPDGGVRTSGIPTVVDRLIQQAIAQQLSAIVDKSFSDSSYGFRPGRNTWQAMQQAQRYIRGGKRWVVDMDLEKFFDRVGHRLLMTRLARMIKDRRVLRLIRRYLKAEMVRDGQREKRQEGMPQGGPQSPLLSNVLLDELDGWIKRKLRYLLWRQWKRAGTRMKNLQRAGLSKDRAMISAYNNLGPWWNSGSSHMNQAIKNARFRRQGLISLLEQQRQFQS